IRDGHVTGVQTCALPISDALQLPIPDSSFCGVAAYSSACEGRRAIRNVAPTSAGVKPRRARHDVRLLLLPERVGSSAVRMVRGRSEERRVGKEGVYGLSM